MKTDESLAWLREAVGGIKYPPDRKQVEEELYTHLIERNRDFLAAGCTEREADRRTCLAMGDAGETRRALAAIHRPFWGYAFLLLRILAAALLLWALIAAVAGRQELAYHLSPLVDGRIAQLTGPQYVQDASCRCGDYTLTLKQAGFGTVLEDRCLLLQLVAATGDPFLGAPTMGLNAAELRTESGAFPVRAVYGRELVFTSRWLLAVYDVEETTLWAQLVLSGPEGDCVLPVRLGEG